MGQLDSVLSNPATRRTFLKSMAVAGGAGVLAACRKQAGVADEPSVVASEQRPPIEDEPGTLKIYEWAGYETPFLWKEYANKGYPEPSFDFYTNTEQALAKTGGGFEWDLVHPETGYIQDYLNLNAIQAIDTSLIPTYGELSPELQQYAILEDGKQYGLVLDWGYSGVIIRTDKVDPSINSYSYLFDDNLAGHIAWFDTPWILQQAGLVLGIDPNQTFAMTDDEMRMCTDYCIDKKKNLYNIWVDYTAMWDDVRQGNVWAAYSWPDTFVALKEEVPVQYIRPQEGVLSWAEVLAVSSQTENWHHAHEYMDAWADVKVAERMVGVWGYGHSNTNLDLDEMDPEVVEAFGLDDPIANLSEPLSYFDRYQPDRARYTRAWEEVKAAS
jgi:spermidine/putrescine transport system substrate-binding protein